MAKVAPQLAQAQESITEAENAALEADRNAELAGEGQETGGQVEEAGAAEGQTGEAEGEAGAGEAKGKQTMVPHGALHEEREKRKAIETRAQQLEQQNALLAERTTKILEVLAKNAEPKPQEVDPEAGAPDFKTHPGDYIVWKMAQQEKEIAALKNGTAQQTQQAREAQQQTQAIEQLRLRANAAENEFSKTTPDYQEAVNHIVALRHKQLEMVGVTDPVQRAQTIGMEAMQIAAQAFQTGKNPAEIIYGLAGLNGYVKKAPQGGGQQPNGAQRVETVERGQRENATLGGARGKGATPLTVQRLLEMSPSEFDAAISSREGRALMG